VQGLAGGLIEGLGEFGVREVLVFPVDAGQLVDEGCELVGEGPSFAACGGHRGRLLSRRGCRRGDWGCWVSSWGWSPGVPVAVGLVEGLEHAGDDGEIGQNDE